MRAQERFLVWRFRQAVRAQIERVPMLILDFAIHKRKIKTAALGESELLAEFARPVIVVVVQEGDVGAAGGENALVARERAAEVLFVLHIEKARVADGLHRFARALALARSGRVVVHHNHFHIHSLLVEHGMDGTREHVRAAERGNNDRYFHGNPFLRHPGKGRNAPDN